MIIAEAAIGNIAVHEGHDVQTAHVEKRSSAVIAGINAAWRLGDDALASRLIDVHLLHLG